MLFEQETTFCPVNRLFAAISASCNQSCYMVVNVTMYTVQFCSVEVVQWRPEVNIFHTETLAGLTRGRQHPRHT